MEDPTFISLSHARAHRDALAAAILSDVIGMEGDEAEAHEKLEAALCGDSWWRWQIEKWRDSITERHGPFAGKDFAELAATVAFIFQEERRQVLAAAPSASLSPYC